jgi:voltage-gated potassium channel Kch
MLELFLVAAATDQDAQAARIAHDAIVRGWGRGPIGVLEELALEGITLDALDRAEDTIAQLRKEIDALQSPTATAPKRRRRKTA